MVVVIDLRSRDLLPLRPARWQSPLGCAREPHASAMRQAPPCGNSGLSARPGRGSSGRRSRAGPGKARRSVVADPRRGGTNDGRFDHADTRHGDEPRCLRPNAHVHAAAADDRDAIAAMASVDGHRGRAAKVRAAAPRASVASAIVVAVSLVSPSLIAAGRGRLGIALVIGAERDRGHGRLDRALPRERESGGHDHEGPRQGVLARCTPRDRPFHAPASLQPVTPIGRPAGAGSPRRPKASRRADAGRWR